MSRKHAYPTKKMSTIVVFQMSVNCNTCQSAVCVDFVCLYAAQHITVKGANIAHTRSVRPFLQTCLKKNWQNSSSVTTMACTRLVLLMTMHLALCLQMPGIRRTNWHHTHDNELRVAPEEHPDQKDSYVGDEAQSKRQKLMDEFDIIPE